MFSMIGVFTPILLYTSSPSSFQPCYILPPLPWEVRKAGACPAVHTSQRVPSCIALIPCGSYPCGPHTNYIQALCTYILLTSRYHMPMAQCACNFADCIFSYTCHMQSNSQSLIGCGGDKGMGVGRDFSRRLLYCPIFLMGLPYFVWVVCLETH